MKAAIRHSGAVNSDPRFTFEMTEIRHPSVTVNFDLASVRFEATEAELRDVIRKARTALEECRLRGLYDKGLMSFDEFDRTMRELEENGLPENESNTPEGSNG